MITVTADNLPRKMQCRGHHLIDPRETFVEPDDQTIRNEGIAAHYMANAVFRQQFSFDELIDRKAPNGVLMSGEMASYVSEYLSALDCGETEAETSFGTTEWRIGARCDHRVWRPEIDTLTIDDLKYGYGPKEPEMNWTLIAHAIGTCIFYQITPSKIVLRIHQPRAYHPLGTVREWIINYDQLMQYYAEIVEVMTNPSDVLQTGPNCRKCHGLNNCPARRASSMFAVDYSQRAFNDDLPDNVIGYEIDVLTYAEQTITQRKEALEALAKHRIENGHVVDGYALEDKRGNTRWIAGLNAEALSIATGKNLRKPATLMAPGEAKKLGIPDVVMKGLTERPMTGKKLVRVNANDRAQRIFNKDK